MQELIDNMQKLQVQTQNNNLLMASKKKQLREVDYQKPFSIRDLRK